MNVLELFKKITTFVFDVDGVLTDGNLIVLPDGLMARRMNIKDGYALPPEKPGLGIELTGATIKRYPFQRGSGEFNSVPGKFLTT